MLFAAGILLQLAVWAALLHWHGVVAEEQAVEQQRLEDWCRRLADIEAKRPKVYDQDRDGVVDVWARIKDISRERYK